MISRPHDYARSRKKQAILITLAAAILSIGLVTGLIVFCYHSSHLQM